MIKSLKLLVVSLLLLGCKEVKLISTKDVGTIALSTSDRDRYYIERMNEKSNTTFGQHSCEKCGCQWKRHKRFEYTHIVCTNKECKCIHLAKPTKTKKHIKKGLIDSNGNI